VLLSMTGSPLTADVPRLSCPADLLLPTCSADLLPSGTVA